MARYTNRFQPIGPTARDSKQQPTITRKSERTWVVHGVSRLYLVAWCNDLVLLVKARVALRWWSGGTMDGINRPCCIRVLILL